MKKALLGLVVCASSSSPLGTQFATPASRRWRSSRRTFFCEAHHGSALRSEPGLEFGASACERRAGARLPRLPARFLQVHDHRPSELGVRVPAWSDLDRLEHRGLRDKGGCVRRFRAQHAPARRALSRDVGSARDAKRHERFHGEGAELRRVAAPRYGDRTAAYRIVTELAQGGRAIKVYLDVAVVLRGRSIGGIFFTGVQQPVADQRRIVTRMATRLR